MKVEISYIKRVTKVITVPKEWEFYFRKDEDDWTDEEWDRTENEYFLNLSDDEYEDIEIEREV